MHAQSGQKVGSTLLLQRILPQLELGDHVAALFSAPHSYRECTVGKSGGSKSQTLSAANIGYKSYGLVGGAGGSNGIHDHGPASGVPYSPFSILDPSLVVRYTIKF